LSEILAAIDDTNDLEYLAFVVGLRKEIQFLENKLPPNFSHMTRYSGTKQEKIKLIQNLDFSNTNVLSYCVKFSFSQLRQNINKIRQTKKLRKPESRINVQIGYELNRVIRNWYDDFLAKRGYTFQDISFQVDNALLITYLNNTNISYTKPDRTLKLADCIVHANGKHWPVYNVKHLGDKFKTTFHKTIINRISRQ
jgi:hypothetical protein